MEFYKKSLVHANRLVDWIWLDWMRMNGIASYYFSITLLFYTFIFLHYLCVMIPNVPSEHYSTQGRNCRSQHNAIRAGGGSWSRRRKRLLVRRVRRNDTIQIGRAHV